MWEGSIFGRKTLSVWEKYFADLHWGNDNFLSITREKGRICMSVNYKGALFFTPYNSKTVKVTSALLLSPLSFQRSNWYSALYWEMVSGTEIPLALSLITFISKGIADS